MLYGFTNGARVMIGVQPRQQPSCNVKQLPQLVCCLLCQRIVVVPGDSCGCGFHAENDRWMWFAEHAEGLRQQNEKLRASAAAHEAEAAEQLAGGALSQQVRAADLTACHLLTCQRQ